MSDEKKEEIEKKALEIKKLILEYSSKNNTIDDLCELNEKMKKFYDETDKNYRCHVVDVNTYMKEYLPVDGDWEQQRQLTLEQLGYVNIFKIFTYDSFLALAVEKNDLFIIKMIGQYIGKDELNQKNSNDLTPMDIACIRGDVDLLQFLIDKGIDLFYIDETIPPGPQITPLTHLVYLGNSNPTSKNGKLITTEIKKEIKKINGEISPTTTRRWKLPYGNIMSPFNDIGEANRKMWRKGDSAGVVINSTIGGVFASIGAIGLAVYNVLAVTYNALECTIHFSLEAAKDSKEKREAKAKIDAMKPNIPDNSNHLECLRMFLNVNEIYDKEESEKRESFIKKSLALPSARSLYGSKEIFNFTPDDNSIFFQPQKEQITEIEKKIEKEKNRNKLNANDIAASKSEISMLKINKTILERSIVDMKRVLNENYADKVRQLERIICLLKRFDSNETEKRGWGDWMKGDPTCLKPQVPKLLKENKKNKLRF